MDWEAFKDRWLTFGEGTGDFLLNIFGSRNDRILRGFRPAVDRANSLEDGLKRLTPTEIKERSAALRAAVRGGKSPDEVLPEAFALAREASRRTLGMRPYDVQLVGGIALHQGSIAEMMTGEGKTLVATMPLYLNSLLGRQVFLVTVNDYLARRDAGWMGPIYEFLGCSVGAIQSQMASAERVRIYKSDIVYGTNSEFGFDYLRDNMKMDLAQQVQKDLYYAIVDEVDSILVDEARTPLIISGPAEEAPEKYKIADRVARRLTRDTHFEIKEKERQAILFEAGIEEAEKLVGVPSFYTPGNEDWTHYLENALRAHHLYAKDVEYVVDQGEIVIVDEFTGRKMPGRRWSDGLHQSIEVKEGLPVRQENQTLATITYQNYFRLYEKLGGMTGTAHTEAAEFKKIYDLDVVTIPTNRKMVRDDRDDIVYRTEPEKWKAIVDEVSEVHGRGQPLLIGTTSIEKSEHLAKLLSQHGVRHEVLNAKQHEREAHIIARAGERGSVTVSTNMAGRGTDVRLGGNLEYRLRRVLEEKGLHEGDAEKLEEIDAIRATVRAEVERDEAEVRGLGGLYVLGTERHEARRIDNQLRGRSGRQGDPGVSRFFLSLEDDLMRRFYRDWVKNAMKSLGMTEGVPIESRMVSNAIRRAQKKVEEYHFEVRKSLIEYDEVLNEQRKAVYGLRQETLRGENLRRRVEEMIASSAARAAAMYPEDPSGLRGWFQRTYGCELPEEPAKEATGKEPDIGGMHEFLAQRYEAKEVELGELPGADGQALRLMRQLERYVLLNSIDAKWKDHLHALDALKTGIGLRGYAQKDPKSEYKREAFELFQRLLEAIEEQVSSTALRLAVPPSRRPLAGGGTGGGTGGGAGAGPGPAGAPVTLAPGAPRGIGAAPAPLIGTGTAGLAVFAVGPKGMAGTAASSTPAAQVGGPAAGVPGASGASGAPGSGTPPRSPERALPAGLAFDLARRQRELEARRQQGIENAARGSASSAAPGSPPGSANGAAAAQPAGSGAQRAGSGAPRAGNPRPDEPKVGRNDPCPCGSKKKYKQCHGKEA